MIVTIGVTVALYVKPFDIATENH